METKNEIKLLACLLFALACFVVGVSIGMKVGKKDMRVQFEQEAVSNGHAIYNTVNGVWQWK